ncbi:unannotated protein [freshwater metagenome]|uniref:Unannotated protein n=1 Tax=freshwater metagenome TaxID=449393 RepID=A0A6J6MFW1_9ZZZZ
MSTRTLPFFKPSSYRNYLATVQFSQLEIQTSRFMAGVEQALQTWISLEKILEALGTSRFKLAGETQSRFWKWQIRLPCRFSSLQATKKLHRIPSMCFRSSLRLNLTLLKELPILLSSKPSRTRQKLLLAGSNQLQRQVRSVPC